MHIKFSTANRDPIFRTRVNFEKSDTFQEEKKDEEQDQRWKVQWNNDLVCGTKHQRRIQDVQSND